MKVLLISEYFPPKIFGGGEISAYMLAKNLAKKNIDVTVLTTFFKGLKEKEKKERITILRYLKNGKNPLSIIENIKRALFLKKSILKEVKKLNSFDAVHFLNTTSILGSGFKTKAKKIATINGYTAFCPKRNLFYKEKTACNGCNFIKFLGCISRSNYIGKVRVNLLLKYNPTFWFYLYFVYLKQKKALKNIDKFISISDFITNMLIKSGINRNKITKIPNIGDMPQKGPKYKIKEKGVLITYIGALEKIKGVEMLIRAFNSIGNRNAKLMVVGKGLESKRLKRMAGKNVFFPGGVDYKFIPSIYLQSDIIVMPALWPEPFSRIMMEATFFGKPILATDIGGNKEGIINGKNGYLVKSEKDLKEKLIKLIADKK
ncbi:glycosyltransferase, partial [Candidatus Woesearchaeota archaeon]|nr:glycosyltransferase [Candidatus Woesearchaeota archaeon]